ncbi:hypothetical protein N9B82_01690 [Saprospiraceae bacterium]|nr:hypothetical protein [Saprospiraceae bacterium]
MLKSMMITSILCCSLLTVQAQFSNLKNTAKPMAQNAIPSLIDKSPDQGITSKVHENHRSKIVFAKKLRDIQFKNENVSAFQTDFLASESIYARVYLEQSIGNTPHGNQKSYKAHLMYDLYIDGKKIAFKKAFGMYRHIPENKRSFYIEEIDNQDQLEVWTSWRPTLLPNESDDDLKYGSVNIMARSFALSLLELTPGKHDIEIRMYSMDMATMATTPILASGSFTLSITEKDKKALTFKYSPPLPNKAWLRNDEKIVIEDATRAFEVELRKKPLITGIYSPDWQEGTYTLTGKRYRKIAAWAVFDDTDGDGQVPVTTFNFISDYSNGAWSKLRFDSFCLGCPDWDVEVDAVKAMLKTN